MKWALLTALALAGCYDPNNYPCHNSSTLLRPGGQDARCDHRATLKTEAVAGGILATCTCQPEGSK